MVVLRKGQRFFIPNIILSRIEKSFDSFDQYIMHCISKQQSLQALNCLLYINTYTLHNYVPRSFSPTYILIQIIKKIITTWGCLFLSILENSSKNFSIIFPSKNIESSTRVQSCMNSDFSTIKIFFRIQEVSRLCSKNISTSFEFPTS